MVSRLLLVPPSCRHSTPAPSRYTARYSYSHSHSYAIPSAYNKPYLNVQLNKSIKHETNLKSLGKNR